MLQRCSQTPQCARLTHLRVQGNAAGGDDDGGAAGVADLRAQLDALDAKFDADRAALERRYNDERRRLVAAIRELS